MQILEASQEKLTTHLKDEINQRENIERKIFQMNENFNNKFSLMQRGIDDFSYIITDQISEVKTKLFDQVGSNQKGVSKSIDELSKKYEIIEQEHNSIINEHKSFKMETSDKILDLDENITKSVNFIKKDVFDSLSRVEYLVH